MKEPSDGLSRRDVMKYSVAGAAVSLTGIGCAQGTDKKTTTVAAAKPKFVNPGNKAFYKADGAFDPDAAKKAYLDMMNAFGYPIPDVLKTDEFWVCDFLSRDCEKLGMGGIFWINDCGTYGDNGDKVYKGGFKDQKFGYLGHEIYLLPGQMLPEHRHIGNGGEKGYGPKMESWQVRYGEVEFFGQHKGAGDETLISDMPKEEQPWGYGEDWFKSKYVTKRTAKSGKLYSLEDPETWHFQRAGKEGAIVTEYATYHNHVCFSKPGMEFKGSPAKA